jgi:ribosomal protein S18 acetylase RimI-like enzyme
MMTRISKMNEDQLPLAAKALSNAFHNDPLQTYAFPDEEDRRACSPSHFSAALNYGAIFGEIYVADNVAGASIWLGPGETDMTPERGAEAGFTELPDKMGHAAFERFFTALEFMDQYHKQDMAGPHWYTMVLGVDPAFQGQGLGRALLEPVLERSRAEMIPVYLETAQPSNVSFYKNVGFDVLRELTEPSSTLPVWTFRYSPWSK